MVRWWHALLSFGVASYVAALRRAMGARRVGVAAALLVTGLAVGVGAAGMALVVADANGAFSCITQVRGAISPASEGSCETLARSDLLAVAVWSSFFAAVGALGWAYAAWPLGDGAWRGGVVTASVVGAMAPATLAMVAAPFT